MDWLEATLRVQCFLEKGSIIIFAFSFFFFFSPVQRQMDKGSPGKVLIALFFSFKWFGGSGDPLIKESVSELGIWPLPF